MIKTQGQHSQVSGKSKHLHDHYWMTNNVFRFYDPQHHFNHLISAFIQFTFRAITGHTD